LKLEADLAIALPYQERGKRAACSRRHELQQICLAGRKQLLHLCALDGALQYHPSRAEIAGLLRADCLFANIGGGQFENRIPAFRAGAERFLAAEIRRDGVAPVARAIAKIELNVVGVVELQFCRERTAKLASEAFQRSDFARGEQCLGLGSIELAAGDNLPDTKIA